MERGEVRQGSLVNGAGVIIRWAHGGHWGGVIIRWAHGGDWGEDSFLDTVDTGRGRGE